MTFQEAVLKARSLGGCKFGRELGAKMKETAWADFAGGAPYSFIAAVLVNDWEVEIPPMDFATAMKHLQDGKKVRRREWGAKSVQVSSASMTLPLTYINLEATDWEVID